MSAAPPPSDPRLVVSALGLTQILAWGSTYYLLAVVAAPIAQATGWSLTGISVGLSAALLISAVASTFTGRLIQRFGGRPVLAASSCLIASGLALLGLAESYGGYLWAWLVIGLGMSGGLYDAGFGTLGRLYGTGARKWITILTLFGGFASTVCWPLSGLLVATYGWRNACLVYALIHALVCLPIHLLLVPGTDKPALPHRSAPPAPAAQPHFLPTFVLLVLITTLTGMIASMMSVHLLSILHLRGIDLAGAVALGALLGPAQVGARIIEMMAGGRHHPIYVMLASVALMACGLAALASELPLIGLALVLYGAGNGVHTVARGALPLVLFDPGRYAELMGRLGAPSLAVQAIAPSLGAMLLTGGAMPMLAFLTVAAILNIALACGLFALTRRAGGVRSSP